MANKIVQIDISTLAYNLNAIMDFVFQTTAKEKTSEIKEIYDKDKEASLGLSQKILTEVKSENLNAESNIRFDLIRQLMSDLNGILMTDEYDPEMGEVFEEPKITNLASTFALNTLINEGMLINMNIKDIIESNEQE